MQLIIVLCLFLALFSHAHAARYVAVIQGEGGRGATIGSITFESHDNGQYVRVFGYVSSLPRSNTGLHGFHVHELGDMTEGCTSAGSHFNPTGADHGGQTDATRHVGDLGNVVVDENGNASIDIYDSLIALEGEHSILGRSVVIHANEDDLGTGGNEDSRKTGNSGARVACGVIARAAG